MPQQDESQNYGGRSRGEATIKSLLATRRKLKRIRRTSWSNEDKTAMDNMLGLNGTSLANAERVLATAMANLALEDSRGR